MSTEESLYMNFKASMSLYRTTGDTRYLDSWVKMEVLWLQMLELESRINEIAIH